MPFFSLFILNQSHLVYSSSFLQFRLLKVCSTKGLASVMGDAIAWGDRRVYNQSVIMASH